MGRDKWVEGRVGASGGGWLQEAFGWRAIFWLLTALGALFVVLMAVGVPETNARRDPTALHPGQMGRNLAVLLGDRSYLGYVLVTPLMFAGQFPFLSPPPPPLI